METYKWAAGFDWLLAPRPQLRKAPRSLPSEANNSPNSPLFLTLTEDKIKQFQIMVMPHILKGHKERVQPPAASVHITNECALF